MPHVLIVGGGFGGLRAARTLARQPVSVTLIDRQNHHLFQPLLYQVATAGLSPGDIASPIRSILRGQRNLEVLLGDVQRIDTVEKTAYLVDGSRLRYDFLIVAAGTTHAYFGHDEWQQYAPGLKTLEDALHIRRRVLLAFERAERESDADRRAALLTFVIVGAGPTGVELAGALAEVAQHSLTKNFRHFDPGSARILLVEGGPAVLASFPASLQAAALHDLRRLGVDVRTNTMVTAIGDGFVDTSAGRIAAATVLWAAGVAASPLGKTLGVPLDRVGRVKVNPDLTIPGHPEIFVIGDLAALEGRDGQQLPGVAQVAMQMASRASRNIALTLSGRPMEPFSYRDYGNLATIGRAAAVADFHWLRLKGFVGWVAWLFIHLVKLIGFRNRILVLVQWAWAYFSYQRSVRLIVGRDANRR